MDNNSIKLDVKEVLTESVLLYKENFRHFIGPSLIYFSYLALMQAIVYLPSIPQGHPLALALLLIILPVLLLVVTLLAFKFDLAIMIFADSMFFQCRLPFGEAYRLTKGKFWLFFGCSMLVGLFTIPSFILAFFKVPFASQFGAIYMAFVNPFFFTLAPMIALEPKTNRYLTRATKMIKGNYGAVFILTLLTATLLAIINGVFTFMFQGNALALFIRDIVYACIHFFLRPFTSIISVIVYRRLVEKTKNKERREM